MGISEEPLPLTYNLSSSILHFLLSLTLLLTIYHFWFQSLRFTKLGNKLPGIKPIPILGNAHEIITRNPTEIMNLALCMAKEKGKIVRFWFGSKLGVAILDPRDVELILGSNVHLEKSPEYKFFAPWLGDGLLISKGEKWRSHRKMIAPTFHQSILKTFIPTFNKNARDLVENLRKEAVGKVCDVHDYMSGATVDVLLETVMGARRTGEAKSSFKYAKAVMENLYGCPNRNSYLTFNIGERKIVYFKLSMCAILHLRHINIFLRPDFIFRLTRKFREQISLLKTIHGLTNKVIVEKKKDYFERVRKGETSLYNAAVRKAEEESQEKSLLGMNFGSGLRDDLDENDEDGVGEKKRLAFLDFMVEAGQTSGNSLSDEDIKDEVNTIMFEGHDTTAAATSFFLCMLGVHQDVQEKVHQELKEIFKGSDRPVSFSDILEMKYLERVLLETLRLYPPVPIITRIIREDVKLVSADYILPKGTTVAIGQFMVHRDPKYFPNPEKFDPDNFLPERCQQRHYYSYIPFSAGPRSCVGRKYAMLKMKVLLATIVRNFKVKSVVDESEFQLQADIILKRSDGFRLILEERK